MRMVHPLRATGPLAVLAVLALLALLAVLGGLAATVGLGLAGWLVGTAGGVVVNTLLARGLARRGEGRLGPADRVTLARATLTCGVAALTADSLLAPTPGRTLVAPSVVAVSVVALLLDAVDGRVARRTGTVSPLGARFDMEADAYLILVLSVYVSADAGPWVLAIGAARYALLGATRVLPWLRGSVPPRYWAKVVAATQGAVLTCAAAQVLPGRWTEVALAVALVLLAESFGREVWTLWRTRSTGRSLVVAVSPWRG
jgi:phosphatidylglycerophosphate synthase